MLPSSRSASGRILLVVAALGGASCSREISGPSPVVSPPVVPGTVCDASNTENAAVVSTVTIRSASASFSPIPTDVLKDAPSVAHPTVSLVAGDRMIELTRVEIVSTSEIRATLGAAEEVPAGNWAVTVTNPNGRSASADGSLRVVDPPVVTSLAVPTAGSSTICNAVDSTLTVTGTGFRPEDGEVVELLDAAGNVALVAAASDVAVLSPTSLTLFVHGTSPALAPGTYGIRVTGKEGPPACRGTKTGVLEVVPAPTITSVAPVSTCTEVNATFQIDGTGFRAGLAVAFGAVQPTSVTLVSDTQIQATFTSGTLDAGDYPVTVTNPELGNAGARCAATAAAQVHVWLPPSVTQIAPTGACEGGGQAFTVTGTGFHGAMLVQLQDPNVNVPLDGTDVVVASETSLTFTTPALAAGGQPLDVIAIIPEGCFGTLPAALTVIPSPRIDSVEPSRGWAGVDNPVLINGSGFAAGISLVLAGAATGGGDLALTDVTVANGQVVSATVPEGGVPGIYDLVMTQAAGCGGSLVAAFTIDAAPSLTISQVRPQFGWTGTKTPVSIFGASFQSTPRAYLVVPTASPRMQRLKSTAFVSDQSLTAVVPPGLDVGSAPYDLVVINPDGGGGVMQSAFKVVRKPTPTISNVSPGAGTTQSTTSVTLSGCNFRSPTVSTVTSAGSSAAQTAGTLTCADDVACPGDTANPGQSCTLQATLALFTSGAYLVRVTNPDEETFFDFGSFVVTNPSANLEGGFRTAEALAVGRRSLAVVAGRIDSASRFLHAIGGERADGTALDTVEVSPLDLFGTLGKWFVQRTKLSVPRAGHVAVEHGGYVYVVGGTSGPSGTGGASPSGTALGTVERAKILDFSDQPQVEDPSIDVAGTLAKGTWYYVVSAVKAASDPDNPDGETLPSDEMVVTLGRPGSVVLTWPAVAGAAKYRVYRTEAVNGQSQTEVLLAEPTTTTFTDDGTATPDPATTPLVRGSTGVWTVLGGTLAHARFNAGATIAPDGSGQLRVYVVGGHGSCDGTSPAATMDCWEMATLSADGKTLGSFAAGTGVMAVRRERLGVGAMTRQNGPSSFSGTQAFVLASGGLGVSGSAASVEYALVDAATGSLIWKVLAQDFSPKQKDGSQLGVANGFAFAFAGGSAGAYGTSVKEAGPANAAQMSAGNLVLGSWNDAVASVPTARGRFGLALESAYFYLVGGTTDDTDALTSVVQAIY